MPERFHRDHAAGCELASDFGRRFTVLASMMVSTSTKVPMKSITSVSLLESLFRKARKSFTVSADAGLTITTLGKSVSRVMGMISLTSERTAHRIKMCRFLSRFSGPEVFGHTHCLADSIAIASAFKLLAHATTT